jgi:hypothetical protein
MGDPITGWRSSKTGTPALILLLLFLCFPSNSYGQLVIPHLAYGGEWSTTLLIRNDKDFERPAVITLLLDSGETKTLTLTVPAKGISKLELANAELQPVAGAASINGPGLSIDVTLRNATSSVGFSPSILMKKFRIFWDKTIESDTGFAFYAPASFAGAKFTAKAVDSGGQLVGSVERAVVARTHRAELFSDMFSLFNSEARTVEVESDVPLFVLALSISKGRVASVPVRSLIEPIRATFIFTVNNQEKKFEIPGLAQNLYSGYPELLFQFDSQSDYVYLPGESDNFTPGKINLSYYGYPTLEALTGRKSAVLLINLNNPMLANPKGFAQGFKPDSLDGTVTLTTDDGSVSLKGKLLITPR